MLFGTKSISWQARLSFSFLLCLLFSSHALAQSDPPIPAGEVRIHYFRPDGNYAGWALYTWNASTETLSGAKAKWPLQGQTVSASTSM